PALPSATPPARPAISSVWPTCVRMPNLSKTSAPELMDTTGMPAETAPWIDFWSALGSGIDTIRPSGLRATWVSMSWLMATMSNLVGASYVYCTPMSLAPWATPFLTTDQNGSEAWPWVTTASLIPDRLPLLDPVLP